MEDNKFLTIRQAISDTKKGWKEVNADSRLSNRYVYSLIKKHSSFLIKVQSDKFAIVKQEYIFQPLKNIEMEEAPVIDDCAGLRGTCTIYRSKEKLPLIYEDSSGPIIKSVKSVDHNKVLTPTTADSYLRKKANPWGTSNKDNYYFFYNGRIYTPTVNWKLIEVVAFFQEDILDLNYCDTCTDKPVEECRRYMDKRLMLPQDLWRVVSQMISEELARGKQVIPDDNINKNELIRK